MGGGPSGQTSPATPGYGDSGDLAASPVCSSSRLQVFCSVGLVLCVLEAESGCPETGFVVSELEFLTLLPPPPQVLGLQTCASRHALYELSRSHRRPAVTYRAWVCSPSTHFPKPPERSQHGAGVPCSP